MRDPRGVQVLLNHSFGAESAYVRELTLEQLAELDNDWVRWQSIYGQGRTEQAVQFKKTAKLMRRRIKSEFARRDRESDEEG